MYLDDEPRDLRDRLATTYVTALKSQRECGAVTIHVGQDVWDGLKAMAEEVTGILPGPHTLFGFPILLEAAWDPDRIEIRITKTIY